MAVDTPLCSGAELAEFYRIQDMPGIWVYRVVCMFLYFPYSFHTDSEKRGSPEEPSFILKSPVKHIEQTKSIDIEDESETKPFPTEYL